MADESKSSKENQGIAESSPNNAIPRENLIATAANFLQNPRVQDSPWSQKVNFLKSKGLTDEEINLAADRVLASSKVAHNAVVAPPAPHFVERPRSVWVQVNRIGSSVIIIAIAIYGIHRFYKIYIEPWLFGKQSEESRFAEMEQQLLEMNQSLLQLKQTMSVLEEAMISQKLQIQKLLENESIDYMPTPLLLQGLKSEVGSIKSLLLSRHQFPAVPKLSPPASIPTWQLPTNNVENKGEQQQQQADKNESLTVEDGDNFEQQEEKNNMCEQQESENKSEQPEDMDETQLQAQTCEVLVNGHHEEVENNPVMETDLLSAEKLAN